MSDKNPQDGPPRSDADRGDRRGPRRGGPRGGRGGPRNRREDRDQAVVQPTTWNARGEALVTGAHKRLAVWSGIPGEEALVRIEHRGQNMDRGKWLKSHHPHPNRVEPPCDRYNPCGGCPLMHLDADGQARVRRTQIRAALRAAGIETAVDPLVPCPAGAGDFRHLIKLQAGTSDQGHPRIGAFGRSRRLVPIPRCLVATPTLREVMKVVAHHFIQLKVHPWVRGKGTLRYVVARQSASTGEVLITLVAGKNHRALRQLADTIEQHCAPVAGIHLHLNDEPGNAIFSRDEEDGAVKTSRLAGRRFIVDRLADVDYRIGPGDFFQTNPATADRLYRDVIELAAAGESLAGVPVVDLYSGVGGFALPLALKTGWALGVESVEGAVLRARESASNGGIAAEFTHGEVLDVLPDLQKRLRDRRPLVLVNPARRGLEDGVAQAIVDLDPRRLIYVSCNPRALARDLAGFQERGWTVDVVRPYDMFPHTAHVEVVAALSPPADGRALPDGRGPRRRVVRG